MPRNVNNDNDDIIPSEKMLVDMAKNASTELRQVRNGTHTSIAGYSIPNIMLMHLQPHINKVDEDLQYINKNLSAVIQHEHAKVTSLKERLHEVEIKMEQLKASQQAHNVMRTQLLEMATHQPEPQKTSFFGMKGKKPEKGLSPADRLLYPQVGDSPQKVTINNYSTSTHTGDVLHSGANKKAHSLNIGAGVTTSAMQIATSNATHLAGAAVRIMRAKKNT